MSQNKAPYSPQPLGLSKPYCHQLQPSLCLGAAAVRHDDTLPKKKVRSSKGAQEIAFMALQNLLIDRNEKQVHYDDWKAKHERNTPDSTADQRYQARRGLQAKGLVVIDDNKCWINSNLAE